MKLTSCFRQSRPLNRAVPDRKKENANSATIKTNCIQFIIIQIEY